MASTRIAGPNPSRIDEAFYAVNYLAGHKSMAMTKRYDHANEERYGAAIEALDAAGKTSSAEALAAAASEADARESSRKKSLG